MTTALIKLRECTGLYVPLLFACMHKTNFLWPRLVHDRDRRYSFFAGSAFSTLRYAVGAE